jgi:hypothetical protein
MAHGDPDIVNEEMLATENTRLTADLSWHVGEVLRLTLQNEELRIANAIAVAKATQASLELDELARVRARLQVQREAFARLAEVASAIYTMIPEDARKDRDGDAIVACGMTMAQLIRTLAERAQAPKEPA